MRSDDNYRLGVHVRELEETLYVNGNSFYTSGRGLVSSLTNEISLFYINHSCLTHNVLR